MTALPQGWTSKPLGELGIWSGGGTPSKAVPEYWADGSIPWVSPKDMKVRIISASQDKITEAAVQGSATQLIVERSVLIVTRSGILAHSVPVALTSVPLTVNQDIKAITPCTAVDPHFMLAVLEASRDTILDKCRKAGTTVESLDTDRLKALPIPLPPLPEQRRIVRKLDTLSARSTTARTHLTAIEKLVERYKSGVLLAAFRGQLTSDLREQSNDRIQVTITDPFTYTQIAPPSWTQHVFSEVCRIVGGSQPPKSTFVYAPQEGYIRLVQIRDYKSDAKATYIPADLARRFCSPSDIMIGRYGPPIFQILRGIEGAYNVALMKAEPTAAVDQEFLYWYLHHPILFRYVEIDSKRTAGQDGVNKAHLERWPILLPPLHEQREIVRRIETAFAKIDRLAAEAAKALKLLGHLDQRILAKAFAGDLVPQDPTDEPAETLLARIREARAAAPKGKRRRTATTG